MPAPVDMKKLESVSESQLEDAELDLSVLDDMSHAAKEKSLIENEPRRVATDPPTKNQSHQPSSNLKTDITQSGN
jgi:hypothetical protein